MAPTVLGPARSPRLSQKRHTGITRPDDVRLRALQDSLETLIIEARQLRHRFEVLVSAQRLTARFLVDPQRKRRRSTNLKRANRLF
jgi:predicted naringenin-chalcone synthase